MNSMNVPVTVCIRGGPQPCARFSGQGPGGDKGFADLLLHASEGDAQGTEGAWSEKAIEDATPRELDQRGWGAPASDGQGLDLPHVHPREGLLAVDSTCWDSSPTDLLAAVISGPQVLARVVVEDLEEMKCAGTWAPECPPSEDPCQRAISLQPQRDEALKVSPGPEILWGLSAGPETGGPLHGDGQRSSPPLAATDFSTQEDPMRLPVEGEVEPFGSLDMEKELSTGRGLRGWDGDLQGMRGQAGLGNEPTRAIFLPGQGGGPQEAQYTHPPLGTVGDAGRHDEAIDVSSPSVPSPGRWAFGTSAGGSHGHLVNLVVEPPSLGPLRVKIQVRGGDVRALFLADGAVQKAALETGLWDLRQRLVHQGLSVQELAVQVGTHGGEGWQGYLSREGTWAPQGPSSADVPPPEQQVSCTGAVTTCLFREGGTLDLLI